MKLFCLQLIHISKIIPNFKILLKNIAIAIDKWLKVLVEIICKAGNLQKGSKKNGNIFPSEQTLRIPPTFLLSDKFFDIYFCLGMAGKLIFSSWTFINLKCFPVLFFSTNNLLSDFPHSYSSSFLEVFSLCSLFKFHTYHWIWDPNHTKCSHKITHSKLLKDKIPLFFIVLSSLPPWVSHRVGSQ